MAAKRVKRRGGVAAWAGGGGGGGAGLVAFRTIGDRCSGSARGAGGVGSTLWRGAVARSWEDRWSPSTLGKGDTLGGGDGVRTGRGRGSDATTYFLGPAASSVRGAPPHNNQSLAFLWRRYLRWRCLWWRFNFLPPRRWFGGSLGPGVSLRRGGGPCGL